MPDMDWHANLLQRETPWTRFELPIQGYAARSSLECPNYHFTKHSLDIGLGEGHFIRLGYLRKQGEDTGEILACVPRNLPQHEPQQPRGFIRQSIELGFSLAQGLFSSWQVIGAVTTDDAGGSYSLWNLPCTCRNIFSTRGYPHHGKAVEVQGIGKLHHDIGPTGDGVRLIIRKANARTLNYNHAGMESSGNFVHCRTMPFKARTGKAVKVQDWLAHGVAVFGISYGTSITQFDLVFCLD